MLVQRTVTAKQVSFALGITVQAVYGREGKTMPLPIDAKAPVKEYILRDVLLALSGQERHRMAERCGYNVTLVISDREQKEFRADAAPDVRESEFEREEREFETQDAPKRNEDRFF